MAEQTTTTTQAVTPDAFLTDRTRFWMSFTRFSGFVVAFVVLVLVLLWFFLV